MVTVRALVLFAAALSIGLADAQPQNGPSATTGPATSSPAAPSTTAPNSAAPNSPSPNSATANPTAPNATPPSDQQVVSHPPTADDICRAVEKDAAENEIPVEFFARVIWQESRFNALAVSRKGAQGIAQFMPATADYRGLVDPFDPIESLENSARYLRDLNQQFGNLGLAAAAYNAGPGRVSAWLASRRPLPEETRNYVAIITGWTADEWASASPPKTSETTIPQGIPCTRLANLILAPKAEAQRIAAYVPRWGMQLTANWSESKAWATYRLIQKQYAALIGEREPIVIRSRGIGLGSAMRYNIRISDDDRAYLEKFCNKLIAAGGACVVLRNDRG
jgi:Transglycosylase SLT domain